MDSKFESQTEIDQIIFLLVFFALSVKTIAQSADARFSRNGALHAFIYEVVGSDPIWRAFFLHFFSTKKILHLFL